jgi:hypothetical protein
VLFMKQNCFVCVIHETSLCNVPLVCRVLVMKYNCLVYVIIFMKNNCLLCVNHEI